jgi:aspartyl-tRNA(Asn)/glutamyl-tRNA(Gln) amidotransferase subunit C
MSLHADDVKYIARLAMLEIAERDVAGYAAALSRILDLVEQMNRVDTADIDPMAHPLDVGQRLREDLVTEVDRRAEFQRAAPLVENGLYLVPKVIE